LALLKTKITAAVLLIAAISGYLAWDRFYRLPDPATANREGVVRWIVLADLDRQPDAVCEQLVERFESLFGDDGDGQNSNPDGIADFTVGAKRLTAAQLALVQRNVEHLKQIWFYAKANAYADLTAAAQPAFLDRQIKAVFRWAALDQQLEQSAGRAHDLGDALAEFFVAIDGWKRNADAALHERINHVVGDGLVRWLATYDLAQQTLDVRRRVAVGLEAQLGDRLHFTGITKGMPAAEAAQFNANVELLAQAWFYDKAGEYAAIAPTTRPAFLKRQTGVVLKLAEGWQSTRGSSLGEVAALVKRWIAQAPTDLRPKAKSFADALQGAVLARYLQGPTSFSPK
jgi:hypothetical protein